MGNRNNIPQTYLFVGGIIFNLVNGFSRSIWGFFMDKFGFKKLMFIITSIEIIVGSSLYFMVDYKDIYILELLFVAACIGGTYTILAPIFVKVFSLYIGPELYGIAGISIGVANILGPLSMQSMEEENNKSYLIIFLTGVGFCTIKFIILIFFDENKKMYKENIPMTNILSVNDNENENDDIDNENDD